MAETDESKEFVAGLLQDFFDKEVTRLKECISGTVMYKQNFHKKYEEVAELSRKFQRDPSRIHKAVFQTKRAIENLDWVADQELSEIRAAMANLVDDHENVSNPQDSSI